MNDEVYVRKDEKLKEVLKRLATQFLSKEVDPPGIVTVTRVDVLSKGHRAEILFTCFPVSTEASMVAFLSKETSAFSHFVSMHARMRRVPQVTFALDYGEKNRYHIDAISSLQT